MTNKPLLPLDPELLKACIHCGMCLPSCPTYRVTGSEAESPRGRLYLMKKFSDGELASPQQLMDHLDPCLGCLNCQTVCPSGVQYGDLLFQAREELAQERAFLPRAFKRFIFRHVLPNHSLLNLLGGGLRLYQRNGLQPLARNSVLKVLPALGRKEALLPSVPKRKPLYEGMAFGNPSDERVVLFVGCVMDTFYNPVHWATIDVLIANRYFVTIAEQTCCGALAHHSGESDIARHLARENVKKIMKTDPVWIVLNSAGCGATLKEYGHLLAEDPLLGDRAQAFADRVVDIMELLAKKPLAPMPNPVPKTVTYHAACHLHHAQGVQKEPGDVLAQIPGIKLAPLRDYDACCGSAGIYNIEQPELSAERKTANLLETKADCVVTGNPGCMLQIESGLRQAESALRVLHPVELLAQAYRPAQ
jgi:glycolate oxidase iron-sulfur subunit